MFESTPRDRPAGQTSGTGDRPARSLVGPLLRFDLSEELASLKAEPSWQEGDRNARTLVKESAHRIVLTALKAGTLLREHRAPGWASIQVIEGHVRLRLPDGQVVELPAGALLVLEPGLAHDVEALQESAVLLAVAAPDRAGKAD